MKYLLTSPDGKKYNVEAPENTPKDQLVEYIKMKAPKPNSTSTFEDVVLSAGRGLAKGTMGLFGMPGDISHLIGKGVKAAGHAIGLPDPPPGSENLPGLPGSQQIQEGVEGVAGKLGTPQTTAGKFAQSIGEFVPTSFMGPGGKLAKAVTTIGGGVGAQVGEELTKGTGHETAGRIIGGIAGGGLAGVAAAETKSKQLSKLLPGEADEKAAADVAYDAVRNARLQTTGASVDGLTTDIKIALDDELIVNTVAPRTFRALEQLQGGGGDISNLMRTSQKLGKITPSEGTEFTAAMMAKDKIDSFIENVPAKDVLAGDPKFTSAMLDHAKGSWKAYRKLQQVNTAQKIGEHRAAVSGTGANTQNAIRQRVREILDSDKKSRGFSPEAKKKMEEIVMGTWGTNAARYAGKFAPSGPVSAMATGFTGMEAGLEAAAVVGIGATLSKHLGVYLTKRQLRELADIIRSESPIGKPVAKQIAAEKPNFSAILPTAALRAEAAAPSLTESTSGAQGRPRINMPMPFGQIQ